MQHTCMLHTFSIPCSMNPTYMQHACSTHATYMQHTCNIHATYMQHTCSMHATYMQHTCDIYIHATCMSHAHNRHATSTQHPRTRSSRQRLVLAASTCRAPVSPPQIGTALFFGVIFFQVGNRFVDCRRAGCGWAGTTVRF